MNGTDNAMMLGSGYVDHNEERGDEDGDDAGYWVGVDRTDLAEGTKEVSRRGYREALDEYINIVKGRKVVKMSNQVGKGLAAKMVKVMSETNSYVEKDGFNSGQKYKYLSAGAAMAAIRGSMARNGIAFFPSVLDVVNEDGVSTKAGGVQRIVRVAVNCKFADSETGEAESCVWFGTGMDYGEKAIYKAYTGAIKYCLTKTFILQSDVEDDPEYDGGKVEAPSPAPEPKQPPVSSETEEYLKVLKEVGLPVPTPNWPDQRAWTEYCSIGDRIASTPVDIGDTRSQIEIFIDHCASVLGGKEKMYPFFRSLGTRPGKPSDVLLAYVCTVLGEDPIEFVRGIR